MAADRRSLIKAAAAFAVVPAGLLRAGPGPQSGERVPTPQLTLGPFYPRDKPVDSDADLTWIEGHRERALGEAIEVQGTVFDRKGAPLPRVVLEIWQANNAGRYAHPNDHNPAPLDPNFQGYAALRSDAAGQFRLTTIKPAGYPAGGGMLRPPHIHFRFDASGARGATQMFFPGERLNDTDSVLAMLSPALRPAVFGRPEPAAADGRRRFRFDLVLANG